MPAVPLPSNAQGIHRHYAQVPGVNALWYKSNFQVGLRKCLHVLSGLRQGKRQTNKKQQPGNEGRKEELGGMRGWGVGKEKGGKGNIHE